MWVSLSLPAAAPATIGLVAMMLAMTGEGDAQSFERRSASQVHVQVETNRTTYRIGDSVKVRLTLQNVSAEPVKIMRDVPRRLVRLRMMDRNGKLVEPDGSRVTQRFVGSQRPFTLKGGEALTLRWQGQEWMDLHEWEYGLKAPGTYTIVGIPRVWSHTLTPNSSVRSNFVEIRVTR
jgi:hypothetical protein